MSNDNLDTFRGGTDPDSVKTRKQIKILICAVLDSASGPVSKTTLDSLILGTGLANYFEAAQAVQDLIRQGLVAETTAGGDSAPAYGLTGEGHSSTVLLSNQLLDSVRAKAAAAITQLQIKERNERENSCEIAALDNGRFKLICCIKDGENVLLKTEMLASSRLQAESMRDCFLRRPEELYKAVLHSLTGEDF